MRVDVSEVYSAMPTAYKSRYLLKSHRGSVINIHEGDLQSALMEIFSKCMKRSMPEDLDRNRPVNSWVVNYILNHIEHEWVMPNTDPYRKRELLITADYICVTFGYYTRGYERFWVD